MRNRLAPLLRITVLALCVALGLAGAAGLSRAVTTRKRSTPPATVLAVRPEAVRRITLESNGRHVELAHADGSWTAGDGASVVTVALMPDVEGRLFPLQAYRSLPADTSSPSSVSSTPRSPSGSPTATGRSTRWLSAGRRSPTAVSTPSGVAAPAASTWSRAG